MRVRFPPPAPPNDFDAFTFADWYGPCETPDFARRADRVHRARLWGPGPAQAVVVKVKPGEFVIDHPTLINLGFEWLIQGDDNRNAQVDVSYRKQGETAWKQGLPLLRLQGERIYQNQGVFDVISPNMFAGSILDLEPDTAYEARFVMSDPDGFIGQNAKTVTKTVTVRTRPEPKPYAGGRVFHVYPPNYKGTKIEPAFDGLMCAYNYYCGGGDTVTAGRPRVKPGDTILVHAGLYKYHPEYLYGRSRHQCDHAVRGHVLSDRQRHGREADRHQGSRRRRSHLRRQRQLQPVQRQGRELQLLRRRDDPEYGYRRSGRARSSSPARKADRQDIAASRT